MEININDYDTYRLRQDLIDIIGPATLINEYAQADLIKVETCSDYEVILIALEFNICLDDYKKYIR